MKNESHVSNSSKVWPNIKYFKILGNVKLQGQYDKDNNSFNTRVHIWKYECLSGLGIK